MAYRLLRTVRWSMLLVASLALLAVAALPAAAGESLYPTDYLYRDVDGTPLPFQDHATIREALQTAPIIERKLMSRGVAQNIKLLLEYRGVRFQAVLRLIDVSEREDTPSKRMVVQYRDSYIFETAAYELNEMLGIGRIPPTVNRQFGEHQGSVQIWMEETSPEDLMLEEDLLHPPDRADWWRQKTVMWVFDSLIANSDRNQGNLLIDDDWNLWFIDHTRAFRETSLLLDIDEIKTCERGLWAAIQSLDEDAVRERLEPYLTSKELSKLFLRHKKLIKHINKQIKKRGEEKVLYDLNP